MGRLLRVSWVRDDDGGFQVGWWPQRLLGTTKFETKIVPTSL